MLISADLDKIKKHRNGVEPSTNPHCDHALMAMRQVVNRKDLLLSRNKQQRQIKVEALIDGTNLELMSIQNKQAQVEEAEEAEEASCSRGSAIAANEHGVWTTKSASHGTA